MKPEHIHRDKQAQNLTINEIMDISKNIVQVGGTIIMLQIKCN